MKNTRQFIKEIELQGEKIIIRKLALEDYATLLKKLAEAKTSIKVIFEMGEVTREKIVNALPELLGGALPQLIDILSFASEIPADKFKRSDEKDYYGLPEAVEILKAILEVNDFDGIKKNISDILKTVRTTKKNTASISRTKTG